MISLLNRFTIVGTLKECRIDLFPSHIKARFNIEINNQQEITIYYSINKKFHIEKYKEFISLIPKFHPTIKGYVWNGKSKYYCLSSNNLLENSKQKLFISGNILEKNGFVYFNAEYIKITKKINKGFLFEFEGIVIDKEHILNIVNDSPRIFNIKTNIIPSEKIYKFSAYYNLGYKINENNVYFNKQKFNFDYYNEHCTDKKIPKEEINNYLLEWEIINSDSEK